MIDPSSSEAATWAQRSAPAVCEDEGPTMMGPSISNVDVSDDVCSDMSFPSDQNSIP